MSDDLLEKIYHKVEKLSDDMSDMKVVAGKQESNLVEHMRRSDLLEENIEILRESIVPVQKHVDMVSGALKLIGFVGIAAGVVKLVLELV